ncbi:DUF4132 domain-containing protein [Myroides marinus]|nr:DUF4132 domain-containing protein [Myroides marinus]MDM1350011.1 DUF4132 domain-containing protein [Myroides marinus]MDM1353518.1 DUF4132 domain-containing protein [Myroides marinus]MDM1357218.1 DUF4132 domain-containing protein [Myroides marinus]MDM1361045.1 DUF4132 domain-containing protein [Myroides marinus]
MMKDVTLILRNYQVPNRSYDAIHRELYAMAYSAKEGVLAPHIALFGLYFTGEVTDPDKAVYSAKVFTKYDAYFADLLKHNITSVWRDKEYYFLLVYFFGEYTAYWVRELLEHIDDYLLGQQYEDKNATWKNVESTFLKQCNVISGLIEGVYVYDAYSYETMTVELSIKEQIVYDMHLSHSKYLPYIWAVALDKEEKAIEEVVEKICKGNSEHGRLTPSFLLMLMASKQSKYWEKARDILLDAGREEGLIEDIIGLLPHIQIDNLKYFLQVILEHNLTRYEAVSDGLIYQIGDYLEGNKQDKAKRQCELMLFAISHYDAIEDEELFRLSSKEFYTLLSCYFWIHKEMAFRFVDITYKVADRNYQQLILEFSRNFNEYDVEVILFNGVLESKDLELIAIIIGRLDEYFSYNRDSRHFIDLDNYEQMYQSFFTLYQELKGKEVVVKSALRPDYYRDYILNSERLASILLSLTLPSSDKVLLFIDKRTSFSNEFKEELLNTLLFDGEHYGLQGYGYDFTGEVQDTFPQQNQLAFAYLKERKEVISFGCMRFLAVATLSEEEIQEIIAYFKNKFKKSQQHFIRLLVRRQDKVIDTILEKLLFEGNIDQRLAALEGLLALSQNEQTHDQLSKWLTQLDKLHTTLSKSEEEYLILLRDYARQDQEGADTDEELYSVEIITQVELPIAKKDSLFSQRIQNNCGLSKSLQLILKDLDVLEHLLHENEGYEYTHFNYGQEQKVLLGAHFSKMHSYSEEGWTDIQHFQDYPLYAVWEQWYIESGLDAIDLFLLNCATSETDVPDIISALLVDKMPYFYNELVEKYSNYWYAMGAIFTCLLYKYPFEEKTIYCLEGLKTIYNSITPEVLDLEVQTTIYGEEYSFTWVDYTDLSWYGEFLSLEFLEEEQYLDYFKLLRWRELNCNKSDDSPYSLPFELMAYVYEQEVITKDEFIFFLVQLSNRQTYFSKQIEPFTKRFITEKVGGVLEEFRSYYLHKVIERSNPSQTVFAVVFDFKVIYGAAYFFGLLEKVKTTGIARDSIYYYPGMQISFNEFGQVYSKLIRRTVPLVTDTQEEFNRKAKDVGFTDGQWIEIALACPQWIKYIAQYLDWTGLESAIWWLFAHLAENQEEEEKELLEKTIQRYTDIEIEQFEQGVVDIDWFFSCYNTLGEERWQVVYGATKYMAVDGHTRVNLYADVLLGRVSMKDLKTKIITKRDRNYVRACGLFPLSETNREEDLMDRYELLEQFKKGSKKYGTMRQDNDLKIYNVAMENIARAAGYKDPIRFQWSMESVQVQSILIDYKEVNLDEYNFSLTVEENGKVVLTVLNKVGKELKAIPAKAKKNELIVDLVGRQKALKEQYSRSRLNLEQAMLRQDVFNIVELQKLLEHPIIKHHLTKLVFKCNGVFGFFIDRVFTTIDGEVVDTAASDEFSIAHCYDLYQSERWVAIQSYLFDKQIEQPFKQVFRELYLFNVAEEAEYGSSNRYAGYQVKQGQTLGLFKTRNWQYEYYANFSKLYFDQDIQVEFYIDYSGGTNGYYGDYISLEHIMFYKASTQEALALKEVNPIIFSEVMRDLDLVVSVAYVGEVDLETSMSTVQMRMAIVRETARLLKLSNIEYKERHVVITGTKGTYSLHLGSGVIHLMPGKHLYIEPVLTQDRGKLFLPFADDEPKTTEIVSKALILARDGNIKDTGILSQIE